MRSTERVVEGTGVVVAAADEASTRPALLLPPSDAVRLGAANRNLERLGIPWRFGPPRREASIARGDQVQGVAVTARYPLVARGVPEAETLAVVGREPWIVSGPGYVIVGSPLDPVATSLPVSAGFLPWLGDVLASRLHAEPGTVRTAVPGQRIPRPTGVEAIEGTDGRRIPATGSTIEAPGSAGTFFLIQGSRRVGALVVNPEPQESRLERLQNAELRDRVATSGVRVVDDRAEWARLAFTGSARRSLLGPLLIVILLVLAAEMAAATIGGRARA
ncbi:MAG TPA: hypothetical protein VFV33_03220 [Gemmatimonadaceae bacterium]|nr:hypothetical protein [Gemmatimonadaceae bacterium]